VKRTQTVTIPNFQLSTPNRREFLGVVGAFGATALIGDLAWATPGDIKFGYAAIT